MAQARREPRFSEIEVLPPARIARTAALGAVNVADVSDAVFETLSAQTSEKPVRKPVQVAQSDASLPGLGLLKRNSVSHPASGPRHAGITPGFASFTILSAFAVFWLCGGHALLY
jgi:hypothetical protein